MQIKRLRHCWRDQGQFFVRGQIINVPVDVNSMVKLLPRKLDDEFDIYVDIKKKLGFRSSAYEGFMNKANVKKWLLYLEQKLLYKHYDIKIDDTFFNNTDTQPIINSRPDIINEDNGMPTNTDVLTQENFIEPVPLDEMHLAQQETLMEQS